MGGFGKAKRLIGNAIGFKTRSFAPKIKPFCEQDLGQVRARNKKQGGAKSRVLIVTQPKAGTYLVAEIVRLAGFHHSYLHLGMRRLQAYDRNYLREGLSNPRMFDVACGIEESRKLVRFGELAVSHLEYSADLARQLSKFRIIHVKREMRSSFISWSRMLLHSNKFGSNMSDAIRQRGVSAFMDARGLAMIRNAVSINEWSNEENVLSLKMEEMMSDPVGAVDSIIQHVHGDRPSEASGLWAQATSAETLTSSASFPKVSWTAQDESTFRDIGGREANKRLGYDEE